MRRFEGIRGLVGASLFLALSGCTVYVVPAEEAASGEEEATGVAVSEGAEASGEEEDRTDPAPDSPPGVLGAERRRAGASSDVEVAESDREQRRAVRRRARAGSRELHVPPGHHPPRGQCRIWYEDRAPGRQPAPSSCDRLLGDRYPAGVFILYGGDSWDGDHDWEAVAAEHPGAVPSAVIALSARIGRASRGRSTPSADSGRGGAAGRTTAGAAARPDSGPASADSRREARRRAGDSDDAETAGDAGPREVRVPPRHRPSDGRCRVWYEGIPPGRQEPPRPCAELTDRELESDAFLLYGDRAFDLGHDWATAEAEVPGTVPVAVRDILMASSETEPGGEGPDASGSEGVGAEGPAEEDGVAGAGTGDSSTDGSDADDPATTPTGANPRVDLPDADVRRPGEPRR